jgi:hypothetical protein
VDLDVSGPRGKVQVTDFGDLIRIKETRWLIKGRHLNVVFHIGKISDTTPADRTAGPATPSLPGRVDIIMDLPADKQIALSIGFTDELGHPVSAPANTTTVYTVDDAAIINLTDNGNGTASAAAVGELGLAVVHAEVSGDVNSSGDFLITVVEGLAERVNIVGGEVTEVTPD